MSASSDAAEQVVKMSLDGTEYAIRIAGKGAKEIGVFLVAAITICFAAMKRFLKQIISSQHS